MSNSLLKYFEEFSPNDIFYRLKVEYNFSNMKHQITVTSFDTENQLIKKTLKSIGGKQSITDITFDGSKMLFKNGVEKLIYFPHEFV